MTDETPETTAMRLRPALLVAALVVGLELLVSWWAWDGIPDGALVPIHWGMGGEPDGFAPKEVGLLALPALTAFLGLLLAVLPRFEPRRSNLARSAVAYRTVVVSIVVLMGLLHWVAVTAAADPSVEVGRAVVLGIGVLFAIIGNWLGKVRSNFMFGIRTPWTLASDRSWDRTHRLAGRLWVVLGLVLAALALAGLPGPVLAAVLLGGLLVTTLGAVVYSYRVWATDPGRTSTGG